MYYVHMFIYFKNIKTANKIIAESPTYAIYRTDQELEVFVF